MKRRKDIAILLWILMFVIISFLIVQFVLLINKSNKHSADESELRIHSHNVLHDNDYLVKTCKLYVFSHNERYREEYYNLLEDYERFYGRLERMASIGLTEEETEKVNQLIKIWGRLEILETSAFTAIDNGDFEKASMIIQSEEYMEADYQFTNVIQSLIQDIEIRNKLISNGINRQIQMVLILFSASFLIIIISLAITFKKNIKLRELYKKQKEETELSSKIKISFLENLLNKIDALIFVSDPDTNELLFVSNEIKKQFRLDEGCIGQPCYKILLRGVNERCKFCPCDKLDKDSDKAYIWEYDNNLSGRTYRNTDRYIDWPNGKRVHLQYAVDITDIKQASNAKSTFLAHMSHEIRTPMNTILGITEIQMQKENLSADTEEALEKLYESGRLLLSIINDILDLSKIEAGKLEILPVKYCLPSLVNDVAQINLLYLDKKSIELHLILDADAPLNLLGDELRIKQILGNILSNAFKYTEKGEVELTVWGESPQGEEITLVFRVRDTGQGMYKEQIAKLFEQYTRFNLDTNHQVAGTGLGMSITKRFVDLMGGKIFVESEPGKGSVFTVRLPQKRTDSLVCGSETSEKLRNFRFRSISAPKRGNIPRQNISYGSVLIVDDVKSNIYVTRGMLLLYGLQIKAVSSGMEAIELIKQGNTYDIIFMDHMMPKMNGIEATKILRDMGYTGCIIALTANAIAGQAEVFMESGFDGFISKPIDSRELDAVLNEFILQKHQPQLG